MPSLSRRQLLAASLSALAVPPGTVIAALVSEPSGPPQIDWPRLSLSDDVNLVLHRAPGEDNTQPPHDLKISGCHTKMVRGILYSRTPQWLLEVSGPGFLSAVLPAVAAWREEHPERYILIGVHEDFWDADDRKQLEEFMRIALSGKEPKRLQISVGAHWCDADRISPA